MRNRPYRHFSGEVKRPSKEGAEDNFAPAVKSYHRDRDGGLRQENDEAGPHANPERRTLARDEAAYRHPDSNLH